MVFRNPQKSPPRPLNSLCLERILIIKHFLHVSPSFRGSVKLCIWERGSEKSCLLSKSDISAQVPRPQLCGAWEVKIRPFCGLQSWAVSFSSIKTHMIGTSLNTEKSSGPVGPENLQIFIAAVWMERWETSPEPKLAP